MNLILELFCFLETNDFRFIIYYLSIIKAVIIFIIILYQRKLQTMAIRKLLTFQESQQVPKLKINLGPKKPVEHAFFAVRIYMNIPIIIVIFHKREIY